MKGIIGAAFLVVALLFGTPWLLSSYEPPQEETSTAQEKTIAQSQNKQEKKKEKQQKKSSAKQKKAADAKVTLQVWNGSEVVEMTMEEYLTGVVRGEMPATFEAQALAAQAAAERTYIYYQMSGGRKKNHPGADICMDPSCCNAWVSEKAARKRWGVHAEEYAEKIRQAVETTDGQVMLYHDKPILAVFHSSSAGITAGSGDVWTSDLPYLVSVKSPETAESVPNYYSVNTFSAQEFRELFLAAHPEAKLSGSVDNWIGKPVRNDSDRVEKITIGGVTVAGTEVRSIFSLRSACFTVEVAEDEVTFHVTGYGHGVGMSQYGANELAREGKDWQEILHWYYTGVTIAPYQK